MNSFAALQPRADLQLGSKQMASLLSLLFGLRLLHTAGARVLLSFGRGPVRPRLGTETPFAPLPDFATPLQLL